MVHPLCQWAHSQLPVSLHNLLLIVMPDSYCPAGTDWPMQLDPWRGITSVTVLFWMRKSNYPPVGLPLSGVSPFSQSLCPYLSPLALSPQVLTVLIVAKGRLWICCKILCPSFICHQTFCTKKRLGRNYSWIAETNTDKSETGGEAERKQKRGF